MTLRLFAALALPEDIRDRLEQIQPGLDGWRLSPPENFHVTLCFFGDADARKAEDLDAALRRIETPGFEIWLDGVDLFGGDRPRLAYAAVRSEPLLTRLHDKVRRAGELAGLAPDARRYVPHVTLARPGGRAGYAGRWLAARAAFLAGPIPVDRFRLCRSDLGRAAPVYTKLAEYPLG